MFKNNLTGRAGRWCLPTEVPASNTFERFHLAFKLLFCLDQSHIAGLTRLHNREHSLN